MEGLAIWKDYSSYFSVDNTNLDEESRILEYCKRIRIEIREDIKQARDSIKAVKALADYIDKKDENAYAGVSLLYPCIIPECMTDYDIAKQRVYSELNIQLRTIDGSIWKKKFE